MSWDTDLEHRLRAHYGAANVGGRCKSEPTATRMGDGFLTEIAGKVILTAPARTMTAAGDIPSSMRDRWEKAAAGNPYYQWVQGKFVEAERANRNGAYWSTADLQFGEMSVRNGPLNWLHDSRRVVGTIADNQLVHPAPTPLMASTSGMDITTAITATYTTTMITDAPVEVAVQAPRPYIAVVAALWRWLYPNETRAVEAASDAGHAYFSMECVARQMSCVSDGERTGCGKSYPYVQAMTDPAAVCEHIRNKSSARRMVDPAFLGGALIIPPVRPGWGEARAEVMRQASALAEHVTPPSANTAEWERLMASVLQYAMAE